MQKPRMQNLHSGYCYSIIKEKELSFFHRSFDGTHSSLYFVPDKAFFQMPHMKTRPFIRRKYSQQCNINTIKPWDSTFLYVLFTNQSVSPWEPPFSVQNSSTGCFSQKTYHFIGITYCCYLFSAYYIKTFLSKISCRHRMKLRTYAANSNNRFTMQTVAYINHRYTQPTTSSSFPECPQPLHGSSLLLRLCD